MNRKPITNEIQKSKKKEMRKTREEERTNSTLPIEYNGVIVCEGGENDREKFGALFTSASPRHPSTFTDWFFKSVKLLSQPSRLRL
jgi:hypothetical protein